MLALALTPIIITGGIDLSVGSMMGLAAVVLGALWRDAGVPLPVAASIALLVGVAGGGLNALMITRLKFPPLIVTLGTFSLFRGIAEGLTGGVENYSGFPQSFLFLGQGYVGGVIPTQLFILIAAIAGYWWWLQRTAAGRSLYAIGFSAEGARYAGLPVGRRLGAVYVLSGLASSLAAIIYVAHLGQAKSDAGTGYELMAITAVVLGGASIFGGRGTVLGTVLGLFAIVILQNGLRLSAQPAELAGILTGVLLVATILLDRLSRRAASAPRAAQTIAVEEESEVRNSQIGILSAVVLGAALIVAGSNWLSVRSLREELRGGGAAAGPQGSAGGGARERRPEEGHRADAEGEGRPVLHQLPAGRRRGREGVGRRAVVGRPDRPRPGEAERSGRGVDHARRGRHRRERREQGRHLDRAPQGEGEGHQGRHVGRRLREGRARLLHQPGDAAGHRLHADGRGRAHHGRQGRVRHHHRHL